MTTQLPSAEAEPERYEQQPLLAVVENYILDCIGEFDSTKNESMTLLVRQLFGGGESWQEAVRKIMDLPEGFDDDVRQLWASNQKIADETDQQIHPVQFAKLCADENFQDLNDLVEHDECDS